VSVQHPPLHTLPPYPFFTDSVERLLEGERYALFIISESVLLRSNGRTGVDAASGANIASMNPNSYLANHFILNKRKYAVYIVRSIQHRLPYYSQLLLCHTGLQKLLPDVTLLYPLLMQLPPPFPLLWRRVARR
jgi:hypothetical protein